MSEHNEQSEESWKEIAVRLGDALGKLLLAADGRWYERNQGHDWPRAVDSSLATLRAFHSRLRGGSPPPTLRLDQPQAQGVGEAIGGLQSDVSAAVEEPGDDARVNLGQLAHRIGG
jgi:hypothetical protein